MYNKFKEFADVTCVTNPFSQPGIDISHLDSPE